MSAKRSFDTKIPEDENTDSGFLSGPLSEQLLSSEDLDTGDNSDSRNVVSESDQGDHQLDSGLDLCLSECLSSVKLVDSDTSTQVPPKITVADERNQDIPPLAILFQEDDDGDTQLHIAAVHGCEKSVSTLIRVCPDKAWLDFPNDFGHTALHLAVLSGNAVVTRMLVMAGASLAVRDVAGETPLHLATAGNHVECLHSLLAPVLEHKQRAISNVLNQKNYEGQTCVHIAATAGHTKALQMLVYYGADINARDGLAGWTALHIAARRGNDALVEYLLKRCPGVAVHARDYAGRTARRLARRTSAASAFNATVADSDSEYDSDEEMYDSESESLFEKLRENLRENPINVA